MSTPQVKLSVNSLLTLGIPVLSSLGAAWILDEPLLGWQIVGIFVVLSALAFVIRREAQLEAEHQEELSDLAWQPALEDGN